MLGPVFCNLNLDIKSMFFKKIQASPQKFVHTLIGWITLYDWKKAAMASGTWADADNNNIAKAAPRKSDPGCRVSTWGMVACSGLGDTAWLATKIILMIEKPSLS